MSTRQEKIKNLESKIKAHPNSPKVAAWKTEIKNARAAQKSAIPNAAAPTYNLNLEGTMKRPIVYSDKDLVSNSVATACHPDTHQYQLCDAVTQPVNLLRSIAEYVVTVNFDGSTHAGAFSVATQPSIGSLLDASKQAVGIVNTTAGWPVDFTSSNSYVSSSSGLNPKFDNNVLELISPKSEVYTVSPTFLNYVGNNNTNDGFMFGPNGSLTNSHVIKSLPVTVTSIPTGTYVGPAGSVTLTNCYKYKFPSGTYNISSSIFCQTGTPVNIAGSVAYALLDENNALIDLMYFNTNGTVSYNADYFKNNSIKLFVGETLATSSTQDVSESSSINYRHDSTYSLVPLITWIGTTTYTTLISYFNISTVNDPALPSVSNNGMIVTMRPIAHSALLTNLLPDILAGGNVVGYSAPSGDLRNMYYNQSSLVTPQDWYQLATLNKGCLMHDGKVKDGCYVFTQPWSDNDLLLRTPSEVNNYSYPGIIISGAVVPPSGYSGNISAFRLRVITIWEYVTDSPIFNPQALIGNPVLSGEVMAILARMQHALPNNKHKKYLSKFFQQMNSKKSHSSNWLTDTLNLATNLIDLI